MPRQLPWKTGGGGSRTQTIKPSIRTPKTQKIPDDIDGDFSDDTALYGSNKGKNKAKATAGSDDLLPEPSASHTKKTDNTRLEPRAASSSPPPLEDDALPNGSMRKGVSKFDLRDDEWMMVEDEFLETAKLFTRHLHIAEYDRLKETIEAKKKEAEMARPVVPGAKRSVEGAMKEKAKAQESRQKKAIRDVFVSLGDESEVEDVTYRVRSSTSLSTTKPRPPTTVSHGTESDDLDAPRAPKLKHVASASAIASKPQPPAPPMSKPAPSSFAKPALPAPPTAARPRSRVPRMTPFEMLDDYTPPPTTTRAPPPAPPPCDTFPLQTTSAPSPQPSQTVKTARPRRSIDLLDEWGSASAGNEVSKEVAERIAKRKAERAREGEGKGKKRATRIDDIPTFLI